MTDKEVQHLSKVQLIEILYLLSQENDKLREENAQLKARLDAIVDKLVAEKETCEPVAADSETATDQGNTASSGSLKNG